MDKVKIGLIGAGAFANMVHYPSLSEMEDVEIVGVCDLNKERLEQVAKKYNIKNTFTDYKEMIKKMELDGIYIIMPPHHLYDIVIDCIEAKLNVFIEKPPGISLDQIKAMAFFAEKNGCKTMVGFNRRFIPLLRYVKDIVLQRGPIIQCVATFYKNIPDEFPYYRGAIDILRCDAIHCIDTLRWMAGEVKNVKSLVKKYFSPSYNSFNALLEFENGATGLLLTNWIVGKRVHTFEMHSKGISAFINPDEKAIIYKDNNEEGEMISSTEIASSSALYKFYGYYQENRHFIDCLKGNKQPETSFSDAVKTMELIEKIYKNGVE